MKRLKNYKEQLDAIKDQGEKQLEATKDQGEKHLDAIEKQKKYKLKTIEKDNIVYLRDGIDGYLKCIPILLVKK